MSNQGEALYHLQQIDLALLEHSKRLQSIAARLKDTQEIAAAQKQVDAATAHLKPLQVRLRDLELQLQSTRSKRDETEKRLYSGKVKNPKELQDMEHEIEALKRRDAELEDRILEVMVAVEDAQSVLTTAADSLTRITADREDANRLLWEEQKALEAETARLEQQRIGAAAALSADNLTLYQTMRAQKANRPISKLEGDSCSVCGIEQTAVLAQEVRRNQSLVKCRNCGRILVAVR